MERDDETRLESGGSTVTSCERCDALVEAIDETIARLTRVERGSGSGELGGILRTLSGVRELSMRPR